MSHRLVIVLVCDHRVGGTRCPSWFLGPSATDIAGVRAVAAQKGWTFKPGQPYPHVNGKDQCPSHSAQPRPAPGTPSS